MDEESGMKIGERTWVMGCEEDLLIKFIFDKKITLEVVAWFD